MNNRDNELLRSLQAFIYMNAIEKIGAQKIAEMFEDDKLSRRYLEHHPSIVTGVTDKDMLLLQIDMALDAGDSELFMQLSNELKGEGLLV